MKLVCTGVQHYLIIAVYLINWVITCLLRCQIDVQNITPFILVIYYFFAIIIIISYHLLILIQEVLGRTQKENYNIWIVEGPKFPGFVQDWVKKKMNLRSF